MAGTLNIILDIDNTFLEYTHGNDGNWQKLSEDEKDKYIFEGDSDAGEGFILRPYFKEFFTELSKLAKTVSLWTWSDCPYAKSVKKIIEARTPCKISNVWCDEHAEAAGDIGGQGKDLNYIWYHQNKFQPCDTVLIDDLHSNIHNGANYQNGIQLKKFALWNRVTKKQPFGPYTDMSEDQTLLEVIRVLRDLDTKRGLCPEGEEETAHPFEDALVVGGRRRKTYRRKRGKSVRSGRNRKTQGRR
jgi:hypothetical protein